MTTSPVPPAEFPFIAYYTINTTQTDPSAFYSNVRGASLSKFEVIEAYICAGSEL